MERERSLVAMQPRPGRSELHSRFRDAQEALQVQTERLRQLLEDCRATKQRMGSVRLAPTVPRLFAADVIRLGDAEVLVPRQAIRHAGGIRRLTPTEWQLLSFLLTHPGEVHSRLQLATGAWGAGYAERNSEVEVYISRLRRKLGAAGGMVETVRGLGYRLALSPPPAEPQA